MKKILCPTDFSETADEAIVYAAKLCKKIGAELTLLNVQSVLSLSPVEVIKGKFLATEPIRERLEDQSYQVMSVFKIPCLTEVEPSNSSLGDIIANRAKDFDLIVMGTDGADDYSQFFFGSNSYKVARASSVPVLLIPRGCAVGDISNLVFAFDYEGERKLPMEQVTEWAKLLKVRITVLQVKDHYTPEVELKSKEIEEGNKKYKESLSIDFETIYSDEVINSINGYVLQNKSDALALCSINHGVINALFHKSVIKALSSRVNYPLFVFHE